MLAIAMTLIAGAAAWGFVRSQAAVSEGALNTGAVATNNLLSEHFSIVDMYFAAPTSTSTVTFMLYNIGSVTDQVASVRLYDSAGLVNVLYSSTGTGGSQTDYVYDLRSPLSSQCKAAASPTYESTPQGTSLTLTTVRATNEQLYTLIIPPSGTGGCSGYRTPLTGRRSALRARALPTRWWSPASTATPSPSRSRDELRLEVR